MAIARAKEPTHKADALANALSVVSICFPQAATRPIAHLAIVVRNAAVRMPMVLPIMLAAQKLGGNES